MLSQLLFTSSVALLAARAKADVVPTGPGPNDIYRVGGTCKINWNLDTTGAWDDFSITLKTGDNLAMVELETVVEGLDGTTGTGEYEWTCPDVTPNSKIYFYEFAQAGETTYWTTRFTIAAADGSTTEPTNTDANGIKWGTGRLATSPANGSGAAAASGSASGRASASSGPSRLPSSASASGASSGAVPTAASSSSSAVSSSSAQESETASSTEESMTTVTSTASQSGASSPASRSAVNAAASATPSNTGNGAGRVGTGFALGLVGAGLALFA